MTIHKVQKSVGQPGGLSLWRGCVSDQLMQEATGAVQTPFRCIVVLFPKSAFLFTIDKEIISHIWQETMLHSVLGDPGGWSSGLPHTPS